MVIVWFLIKGIDIRPYKFLAGPKKYKNIARKSVFWHRRILYSLKRVKTEQIYIDGKEKQIKKQFIKYPYKVKDLRKVKLTKINGLFAIWTDLCHFFCF